MTIRNEKVLLNLVNLEFSNPLIMVGLYWDLQNHLSLGLVVGRMTSNRDQQLLSTLKGRYKKRFFWQSFPQYVSTPTHPCSTFGHWTPPSPPALHRLLWGRALWDRFEKIRKITVVAVNKPTGQAFRV